MVIDNQGERRGPGRPTTLEAIEIQNKIKPYFEMGLDDTNDIAAKTGIDEKTVRKYLKIWKEMLLEDYIEDVAERQKLAKVRAIVAINSIIYNLRVQLNQIIKAKIDHEEAWKRNRNTKSGSKAESYIPNPFLENMYIKINMSLLNAHERKAAIEAAPTINEETEKAVLQKMQKEVSKKEEETK